MRIAWTRERILRYGAGLNHTASGVRVSSNLPHDRMNHSRVWSEHTLLRITAEAGQSRWVGHFEARISKEMAYGPTHHMVNIVVILQGWLASWGQGHWFDEAVMMVIMMLWSLCIGCFQVRRRALNLARCRHGHWEGYCRGRSYSGRGTACRPEGPRSRG